jgi:leucyl aminopeptidase
VSYPWAHWDIAGMVLNAKGGPAYVPKGGTGFGVRSLIELARRWMA